jgi:RNA polymerase sigma-70 factor, ECF subfamily
MQALPPERSQSFHCGISGRTVFSSRTDLARPGDVPWDWTVVRARCTREARAIVGAAEAEDAVQEAFIRAWRHRDRFRDGHAPLPWLLQITRREALRILERSNRRRELDLETVPEAKLGAAEPAREPALALGELVDRLGADDRRLLELRYEQDLTQGQVADHLGIPEGTVKVRLHRLRHRLRVTWESEQ